MAEPQGASGITSGDGSVIIKGGGATVDLSVNTGGGITLGGDLGGSKAAAQIVVGIQTVPVSATAPVNGQALILVSGVWTPTAIPLGISPGTGIGVSASAGIYTISNTGVLSFNSRTGAVTLSAADVESTFNAKGDIFLGTGSGTGTLLPIGSTGQVLTVVGGTLVYATPAAAPVTSVFSRTGAVVAVSGDYTVAQVTGAAPLASPALTGNPTAPTQAALNNSTRLATTAYTDAAVAVETSRATTAEALLAPLASPALTGTPTAPTAAPGTNTTQLATTAYTTAAVAVETSRATTAEALLAPLASPALTGNPTAPTQTPLNNSTRLATTAYADLAVGVEKTRALAAEALLAPLASPALTGTPTAPTQSALTNNTDIATTAYADAAVAAQALKEMNAMTVTGIQTSAYNIAANEMVRGDASGGSFAVALPNAPADKTLAGVGLVTAPGANVLTINASGSDTIITTVATSATLKINGEVKLFQYTASTKVWTPLAHIPLTSLTAFIMTAANIETTFTAKGQVYVGTGSGTGELLATGSHGQALRVNGADASGLAWNTVRQGANYIESGCVWTADAAGSTLKASMTSGVCWIQGVRLTVAAITAHTFSANSDTYVDFTDNNDGTALVSFASTGNNSASNALAGTAAGTIRNAIIISGATFIATGNNSNPVNATLAAINQGDTWATLPVISSQNLSVTDSLGNLIYPTAPVLQMIGYQQRVSSFTTTSVSGTVVDVTGLQVTFIVPAGPNRKVRIKTANVSCTVSQSSTTTIVDTYIRNGSTTLQLGETSPGLATGTARYSVPAEYDITLAAGTYTFKVSLSQSSATASTLTYQAGATFPAFITAELV